MSNNQKDRYDIARRMMDRLAKHENLHWGNSPVEINVPERTLDKITRDNAEDLEARIVKAAEILAGWKS